MSNIDSGNSSDNPYQAAAPVSAQIDLGNRKPTSITVFGIINVVFAAMGLCGFAWLLVTTFVPMPQGENILAEFTENPTYKTITLAQQGVAFLITILLLIAGIGLINGRPYGRRLSIAYAIVHIVFSLLTIGLNIAYIMLPAVAKANDFPEGTERVTLMVAGSAAGIAPICGWLYPILLLIFMNRASVVNYMRARARE